MLCLRKMKSQHLCAELKKNLKGNIKLPSVNNKIIFFLLNFWNFSTYRSSCRLCLVAVLAGRAYLAISLRPWRVWGLATDHRNCSGRILFSDHCTCNSRVADRYLWHMLRDANIAVTATGHLWLAESLDCPDRWTWNAGTGRTVNRINVQTM